MPELYWATRHVYEVNQELYVTEPTAVDSVNLSITMPLYSRIVRVVADAAISIRHVGGAQPAVLSPGIPALWEFTVANYGPPLRTSGQPLHYECGLVEPTMTTSVWRPAPAGTFDLVADTVTCYGANPGTCNTPRSDGQVIGPTGVQSYGLSLVISPLIMSAPGYQKVARTATLRVLFEHDGPPPAGFLTGTEEFTDTRV